MGTGAAEEKAGGTERQKERGIDREKKREWEATRNL